MTTKVRLGLAILCLFGSAFAAKVLLFPEHPNSWHRLRHANISASEAKNILVQSAVLVSSTNNLVATAEKWEVSHWLGAWTIQVRFSHTDGDAFEGAYIRYQSKVFPSIIRERNYYPDPSG